MIRINLDALGMCASMLCMLHCMAFPLLLAALPMWKLKASEANDSTGRKPVVVDSHSLVATSPIQCSDQKRCATASVGGGGKANDRRATCCSTPTDFWIHVGLLAAVAPLGLVAWGLGCRHHGRWGVLGLGLAGVLLLSAALLFGQQFLNGRGEQVMTVLGSICMVSAHLWNRRECRCCRTPDLLKVVEVESAAPESQPVPLTSGGTS